MIPVILSGGSGTRLWPVSRTKLPKQFCEIFDQSLHTLTLKRLQPLGTPWVITSQTLRDLTLRETNALGIPRENIVLEPMPKNTAPAIALLCQLLKRQNQEQSIVGIFPADHLIENQEAFTQAITLAERLAQNQKIVTLGIKPTFPSTGYGYIQVKNELLLKDGPYSGYPVERFHEKPDLETATHFLQESHFYWNAGIFVFQVQSMIQAFELHLPEMWKAVSSLLADLSNLKEVYAHIQNISIDYGILEKLSSDQLACVPCYIGWSDVGSWDAIESLTKNPMENTVAIGVQNNFIFSAPNKKYVLIDVEDLIVVDTDDAMMIVRKGSSQSVKEAYEIVRTKWPQLASDHMFEYRPWGQYEILKNEAHFKSKVIEVLPQEQISYQSHTHREEHWILTQGTGEVVLNDHVIPVQPGSYIKIPLGAKHRIRNTSKTPLQFIEVQLGSYFGEDDIIRYQDDYQRV